MQSLCRTLQAELVEEVKLTDGNVWKPAASLP
jgi:hypothetical protein